MKRIILFAAVLVACCAVTEYFAYTVGYHRSSDLAQWLRYGDVVVSLDALSDLRAGHIDEGTHKVEVMFFSHAAMIYGEPRFQHRCAGLTNAVWSGEVRHYLATYGTNRANWTPTMVRLDGYLKNWP